MERSVLVLTLGMSGMNPLFSSEIGLISSCDSKSSSRSLNTAKWLEVFGVLRGCCVCVVV